MNAILTVALLCVAQPVAKSPPKVALLPMARQMSDDYAFHRNLAIAQGKPIVYFIGVDKRPISELVVARLDKLDGYPTNAIVVGVPDPTLGMRWAATLPYDATDAQIRRVVTPPARPFFQKLQERRSDRRTADDSSNARQLPTWFPKDAVRYHHAEYTQSIATLITPTGDVPTIDKVDRRNLEAKWQFPGGLADVGGWTSDLYKFVPGGARQEVMLLPVLNSFGNRQYEQGHYRSYPDGTWFSDVLSKDGSIFEIRVREKQNGKWSSYVAYRNARSYPSGYVPVKSSECSSCHDKAGTGGYAVGMVPGSDTVLSDPFDALE